MKNPKTFFIVAIACLTFVSGARAQEYEWHITYPPHDSDQYVYNFYDVDCYGEVCTAVGTHLIGGTQDIYVDLCFRSTDDGLTWIEQDPGLPRDIGYNHSLRKIQQLDSLNAVAVGDSGLIVRTTDGGNTWQRQDLHSIGEVYSVHFSDTMTGIIVKGWGYIPSDSSNIMITHDGGATWLPSSFCPWYPAEMCHSDGGESFRAIGGASGPVYTTRDDWATFDSSAWIIPLNDTVHVLGDCNFIGADTLVGYGANWTNDVSPYMYITQSTNGGASWSSPNIPDTLISDAEAMSSLDRDIVFYGGSSNHHIAVSKDHGLTWEIDSYIFDTNSMADEPILTLESVAVTGDNKGVALFGSDPVTGAHTLAYGAPVTAVVAETTPIQQSLDIFPNPATNSISIFNSSGELTISDPLGRGYAVKQTGNTLDISSLPSGVYFISDGVSRAKFVKE